MSPHAKGRRGNNAGETSGSLARVVGLWGAVWLGLGSILGTGVFVSLGIAAGVVGSGVVVATVLAALVATANGLSSAQLAAVYPVSGGTYEYGHRLLRPAAGFAAGWMFLVAKSASAATAALGCAGYLLHAFGLEVGVPVRVAVALGIVLLLTALVASGVRRSNRVNIAIVSVTLASLVSFVLFGWWRLGPGAISGLVGRQDALASPVDLLHATALMFVAYTGYARIATLGEEMREPAHNIPRAIVLTLVLSLLLYVSVAATAVAAVGAPYFAASTAGTAAPLEVVARSFRHPQVAWLVAVGAITAMAGVLLNLLLGLSRMLLAMARRREMPAPLARVSESARSPTRAVWTVGAATAALVLVGDVKTTWSFSAFTVLIYYGLTNLAALRLPAEQRRLPRWIAAAGLVSCFGLAFFVDWKVWLTGLVLLGIGFALRAWFLRRAH